MRTHGSAGSEPLLPGRELPLWCAPSPEKFLNTRSQLINKPSCFDCKSRIRCVDGRLRGPKTYRRSRNTGEKEARDEKE